MKKKMIFISTGRCGTSRIAQILTEKLSGDFCITHQMPYSRLANIVGNLIYYCGNFRTVKDKLYNFIISNNMDKNFISTDPLTAMIIPEQYINSQRVCLIHIVRNPESFAKSFHDFSKRKIKSFIAHNFVPFWQIDLFPLENALSSKIINKYKKICIKKNIYYESKYSANPNYMKVDMDNIFNSDFLNKVIEDFFGINPDINKDDLRIKAN